MRLGCLAMKKRQEDGIEELNIGVRHVIEDISRCLSEMGLFGRYFSPLYILVQ